MFYFVGKVTTLIEWGGCFLYL